MVKSKNIADVPKCSFCGKTQQQVLKLVAGSNVYICNDCIGLCNKILDEEGLSDRFSSHRTYETPRRNLQDVTDITVDLVLQWMNDLDLSDLAQIISKGARLVDNLTFQALNQVIDKTNTSTTASHATPRNAEN